MDQREELARVIATAMPFEDDPPGAAADAILADGWEKRSPAGEAVRGVGRFITMSDADPDTGNAVLSPDEPTDGVYWTLIGTGGSDDTQNRLGERMVAAINAGVAALSTRPAGESVGVADATGLSWSGTVVTIDFAHPEHARAAFRALNAARASQPSSGEVEG